MGQISLQINIPEQAAGTRPSRALPYVLHVTARADSSAKKVTLMLANDSSNQAGAVFHVYDELQLNRVPRRYVVEAGKTLEGSWDVASDGGAYRLWVLGPNGFHRHFVGNLMEQGDPRGPEIQVCYMTCSPAELSLKLHNKSGTRCSFTVSAEAYRSDGPWMVEVPAGEVRMLNWSLADSGNWYDFSVTCSTQKSFRRRVAGRLENGKDSVSDPSLGGSQSKN